MDGIDHEVEQEPKVDHLMLAASVIRMLVYDFPKYSPAVFSSLKEEHVPDKMLREIYNDANRAFREGVRHYDMYDVSGLLDRLGVESSIREDTLNYLVEPPMVYDLPRKCQQLIDHYRKNKLADALTEARMRLHHEPVTDVMASVSNALTDLSRGSEGGVDIAGYKDKVLQLAEGGNGLASRFGELNLVFDYKGMVVVAARPSDGKTTVALNEVDFWASQGRPGGVYSLEMPGEDLLMRLAASRLRIPFFKFLKGAASTEDKRRLGEVIDKMSDMPLSIHDKGMDINELCASMLTEGRNKNWEYIVIDYLQLIKATSADLRRKTNEYVGYWSTSIKQVQKQLGIPIILISQLSRAGNRNKEDSPPPPTLEALRDSGQIEQDADAVLFLYKKPGVPASTFDNNALWDMYFDVSKQRNGPLGVIPMVFDRQNSLYYTKSDFDERSSPDKDNPLF